MKTAVIYARYSNERQTEQSIEGQLRDCREYADRNDILIVDTYIDRAMTGTNDNRAAFQQMLKDSDKRAWDYVIVYKLDRFSRDKYETAIHRHTLKMNGAKLLSAKENIPDTPEGIILESLLEGMNQYYSAELSQKVRRGMRETRSKGNFTGGYVLFGYRVENKKLVVFEDEAQIVRQIFEECAEGRLVKTILEELREKGILNRGKPFARNTLYHLLANEKYAGVYRHENEIFTNIYPRIVPEEVFSVVKNKIESNKYGKHKPYVCYLLRNKMRCGYCGKPVSSDAGTSKSGAVMRYYKCSGKRADKHCPLSPFRKELLEQLVLDATCEAFASPEQIESIAERILESHRKRLEDQSVLNLLTRDYNDVERAINNLLKALEQGIVTGSTKERLEQLEEKRTLLTVKIEMEKSRNKLLLTVNDIKSYLQSALRKQPRLMIDLLVKEILLYNDKVEIHYNYTEPTRPDDESRQVFCFSSFERDLIIDQHKLGGSPFTLTLKVMLFI